MSANHATNRMFPCPACGRLAPEGSRCLEDGSPILAIRQESIVAGDYIAERPIARGGFGEIWSGHEQQTGREVAIKVLDGRFLSRPEVLARFQRESHAIRALQHPNLVETISSGFLHDGRPYLVMELLHGQSLGEYRNRHAPISDASTLVLFSQLCEALHCIHEARIIHRDLKPDNIFVLDTPDNSTQIKLLDFGIVKILDDFEAPLTKTNVGFGTAHYMSPEQCREAREVDPRSDLYSLGIILFEMLAAKHPFAAPRDNVMTVLFKQVHEPPPLLSRMIPWRPVTPKLDMFLQRCLAKNPDERPQTALDFAEELLAAFQAPKASRLVEDEPTDIGRTFRLEDVLAALPNNTTEEQIEEDEEILTISYDEASVPSASGKSQEVMSLEIYEEDALVTQTSTSNVIPSAVTNTSVIPSTVTNTSNNIDVSTTQTSENLQTATLPGGMFDTSSDFATSTLVTALQNTALEYAESQKTAIMPAVPGAEDDESLEDDFIGEEDEDLPQTELSLQARTIVEEPMPPLPMARESRQSMPAMSTARDFLATESQQRLMPMKLPETPASKSGFVLSLVVFLVGLLGSYVFFSFLDDAETSNQTPRVVPTSNVMESAPTTNVLVPPTSEPVILPSTSVASLPTSTPSSVPTVIEEPVVAPIVAPPRSSLPKTPKPSQNTSPKDPQPRKQPKPNDTIKVF